MYGHTGVTRVKDNHDVPKQKHYSVLIYRHHSTYVEGDERSRTNPGHGYPAHYENYDSVEHYVIFEQKHLESFIKFIHDKGEKNFVFFEVQSLGSLEVSVTLNVKT